METACTGRRAEGRERTESATAEQPEQAGRTHGVPPGGAEVGASAVGAKEDLRVVWSSGGRGPEREFVPPGTVTSRLGGCAEATSAQCGPTLNRFVGAAAAQRRLDRRLQGVV